MRCTCGLAQTAGSRRLHLQLRRRGWRWRRSMGDIEISPIAHVIQLSVAPVFLLSGIGAILAVMTNRLGRIIDRARVLEARLDDATDERAQALEADLESLIHRAR